METQRYTPVDYVAMAALAVLALALSVGMVYAVTEGVPHLEDEITYLFQARTYARAALWAPPPPDSLAFSTPFVLIIDGHRIGKYSIGWPLLLALGERLGVGWLVNPLLGTLLVVLTYALARDLFDYHVGILAGLLALTSPFFLIQSSTYMSHTAGALWLGVFIWAWLHIDRASEIGQNTLGWALAGGGALGMLVLTRPITALAAALPFGVLLVARAVRRQQTALSLLGTYSPLVLAAVLVAALQPVTLALTTGSPTTNLYTLIWPYDRLGFGPDVGPYGGHTLRRGLITARQDLTLWASDLFGWPYASWVPLLPGLVYGIAVAKPHRKMWPVLLIAPFVMLVTIHLAYWVNAQVYGPRYYYEAHAGLCILAALGLRSIAQLLMSLLSRLRHQAPLGHPPAWPVYGLLAVLVVISVVVYMPGRVTGWRGLYGITREPIDTLDALRQDDCVLVFVRGQHWPEYAALFSLNTPWLDGPVVAAHDLGPTLNETIIRLFPDREVWYYAGGVYTREPAPYPAP